MCRLHYIYATEMVKQMEFIGIDIMTGPPHSSHPGPECRLVSVLSFSA